MTPEHVPNTHRPNTPPPLALRSRLLLLLHPQLLLLQMLCHRIRQRLCKPPRRPLWLLQLWPPTLYHPSILLLLPLLMWIWPMPPHHPPLSQHHPPPLLFLLVQPGCTKRILLISPPPNFCLFPSQLLLSL